MRCVCMVPCDGLVSHLRCPIKMASVQAQDRLQMYHDPNPVKVVTNSEGALAIYVCSVQYNCEDILPLK